MSERQLVVGNHLCKRGIKTINMKHQLRQNIAENMSKLDYAIEIVVHKQ